MRPILVLALLLTTTPAHARAPARRPDAPMPALSAPSGETLRLRVRLEQPFGSASFNNGDHWEPALFGMSIAAEALDLLLVEIDGRGYFGISGLSRDFNLRLGAGVDPLDRRVATGRGWTVHLGALAGYRFYRRTDGMQSHDAHDGSETSHCLTVAGELDLEMMFNRGVGLSMGLRVGASIPVAQTRDGYWAKYQYFSEEADMTGPWTCPFTSACGWICFSATPPTSGGRSGP